MQNCFLKILMFACLSCVLCEILQPLAVLCWETEESVSNRKMVKLSAAALAMIAILTALCVLGEAQPDNSESSPSAAATPAAEEEKSYLQMWIELEHEKKARMAEYIKVRGGHPWRFVRCEVCRGSIEAFVSAVGAAGGCGNDDAAKDGAAVDSVAAVSAKPLCLASLKNETDLLMESCVKDFVTNCATLVKVFGEVQPGTVADVSALCDGTDMCTKKPGKKPAKKPGDEDKDKKKSERAKKEDL